MKIKFNLKLIPISLAAIITIGLIINIAIGNNNIQIVGNNINVSINTYQNKGLYISPKEIFLTSKTGIHNIPISVVNELNQDFQNMAISIKVPYNSGPPYVRFEPPQDIEKITSENGYQTSFQTICFLDKEKISYCYTYVNIPSLQAIKYNLIINTTELKNDFNFEINIVNGTIPENVDVYTLDTF
ncbi:MAG TPA: hypothetical protein VI968_02195, partial [archaeon]|nr:hypothetical protein [archaeon]